MAIFNQPAAAKKDPVPYQPDPIPAPAKESAPVVDYSSSQSPARWTAERGESKESLIAADITIEGKIEGGGSVRIAGKFKGDVNVQGDLTIDAGAKLTGGVRADKVTIAGELEGNVEQATLVDLQHSGVIIGDVKAGSLTVAAGARLRGQAEFGWDDGKGGAKVGKHG
jgi:cytoskeletal protein CcmA (bactofilin family)